MMMKKMTLGQIAKAVSGEYIGDDSLIGQAISEITMDSRKVSEGSLFVAIKGERSDGHDYVNSTFDSGALCCLTERKIENPHGPYIKVDSTLQAIKDLAEYYRGLFTDLKVIGITGSVGKTTAKEMISAVLSEKYSVHKTSGNFNNEIGVPMTIFGLREGHEVAVIEMGISDFGEMRRLSKMVRPDIAVISIIGYSHLEFLGTREGVLKAKGEIFEFADRDGVAVVNGDDDLLADMSPDNFSQNARGIKKITYGLGEKNDIVGRNVINHGQEGMECEISIGDTMFEAEIPAFGNHIVYAALAAASVGSILNLTNDEMKSGMKNFKNAGKRADISHTGYITVIDDCYNANPNSMKAALDSLAGLEGRTVAILGDMGELGENSSVLHYEVGQYAANVGIDCLIAVGEKANDFYKGAKSAENYLEAWYFPSKEELSSALYTLIRQNDSVLVKASRSMKFEEIVEELRTFS